MNEIKLRGTLKNIRPSHKIGDVEYNKAELLVPRSTGQEDLIDIKFKKFSNTNAENDVVSLVGNVRTFTEQVENKNRVQHYVFTYFDVPSEEDEFLNVVELDGRICKLGELTTLNNQKQLVRFILANNITKGNSTLTSYIHCVAFGVTARKLSDCKVNDKLVITGKMHSREYKKFIDNEGNFEIRIAHEIFVKDFSYAV